MEPPVISGCELESQLIILEIVFPHRYQNRHWICSGAVWISAGLSGPFIGVMTLDIAVFGKLFLDLGKIAFRSGDIQGIGDGLQM